MPQACNDWAELVFYSLAMVLERRRSSLINPAAFPCRHFKKKT